MSETTTDTVNAATETGEKMIPLGVAAPLLGWVRLKLRRSADQGAVDPVLMACYDEIAQHLGLQPSMSHIGASQRARSLSSYDGTHQPPWT